MPFCYIELGNYTNLGSGMGPPARSPGPRFGASTYNEGTRISHRGMTSHYAERYVSAYWGG